VAEGRGYRARSAGIAAQQQQRVTEAREYYARAERFYDEAGRHYAEAERIFEQALRLDPDDAPAQLGMGNVLYARNKLDEAYAACSRAAELIPNYTSAYHDLALVCQQKMATDPGEADRWCRRALAAWQRTLELMQGDAAYTTDYATTTILPQIAKLKARCGR
jgi:tetratricopeptide (TPR) repeat protein